jgi:hypothetical protein
VRGSAHTEMGQPRRLPGLGRLPEGAWCPCVGAMWPVVRSRYASAARFARGCECTAPRRVRAQYLCVRQICTGGKPHVRTEVCGSWGGSEPRRVRARPIMPHWARRMCVAPDLPRFASVAEERSIRKQHGVPSRGRRTFQPAALPYGGWCLRRGRLERASGGLRFPRSPFPAIGL